MKLSKKEFLLIFSFYFFFSVLYRIVLWYNGGGVEEDGFWGWTNLEGYWFMGGLPYLFYFTAAMIIWFLGMFLLKDKPKVLQMIVVFILIPIVIYYTREVRYLVLDHYGIGHLKGLGAIWDWYIPFLLLLIQFGFMFAYNYHIENQRKLKLEGELRTAALKSELSALKAQLNPHFLYNVFNTINAAIPSKNERARNMIAELSDLFRYQLKASQVEKVSIAEEMEFVQKYLQLEKERFQERLHIKLNVDEELLEEKIPPMLIQPLVENSIKHGLASLIDGGEISISILKKDEKLFFEIADTGVGIKNKNGIFEKGIGLKNTQLRLEKIYKTTLNLADNSPKGLKVSFEL